MNMSTLISVILLLTSIHRVNSLEFRYKVCTAEELRNYVESVCMRMGRDANSVLSLSPYGTISASNGGDGLSNLEVTLTEILRASRRTRPHATVSKRSQDVPSSTLNTCCQESCSIKSEDLLPHCTSI